MAGLAPAIHVFGARQRSEDVDGRNAAFGRSGHDGVI
jgi:hypothetical protein